MSGVKAAEGAGQQVNLVGFLLGLISSFLNVSQE